MIKYLGHGAQKVCFRVGDFVVKIPRFHGYARGFRLNNILENLTSFSKIRIWRNYFNGTNRTAHVYFCFLCFFSVEEYCLPISKGVFRFIDNNQDLFNVVDANDLK